MYTQSLQSSQVFIGLILSPQGNQQIKMIQNVILILSIKFHGLGVIILRQLQASSFLLNTTPGSISQGTIRILLYQGIDAIVCLRIMLILLIEKSQSQLGLKVARHQDQEILIIQSGEIITLHLLVDKCTEKQTGDIGIVEKKNLIEVILGV